MPATKEQIAEKFAQHVERFGFAKASVEDVAAELGISKRTIYQYFPSKKALYAHVVDGVAEEQRRELEHLIEAHPTYDAKMRAFLGAVITGMRRHIQATGKAEWMQEFEVAYDAMARAYGAIGTELVTGGSASGEFVFVDPWLANELIGAIVTHYGVLVREDPALDRDAQVLEAVMRMLGTKQTSAPEER